MIKIITDSTSDISKELQEKLDVEILPLTVFFGDESYLDGVTLDKATFYEKLAASEQLPTTSQIAPAELEKIFRGHIENGDEVVAIFISTDLSGTYQSATIAAEIVDSEHIHVIDSRCVTFALGLIVEEACKLRDKGLCASEIADQIRDMCSRVRLLAAVDTLAYLKKGGRLSTATALIGGILGISPVIAIYDGKVHSIGKARGRRAALDFIFKKMNEEYKPQEGTSFAFGHTNSPEALAECLEFFKPHVDIDLANKYDIGCVVGTHVGPGAVGITYFID